MPETLCNARVRRSGWTVRKWISVLGRDAFCHLKYAERGVHSSGTKARNDKMACSKQRAPGFLSPSLMTPSQDTKSVLANWDSRAWQQRARITRNLTIQLYNKYTQEWNFIQTLVNIYVKNDKVPIFFLPLSLLRSFFLLFFPCLSSFFANKLYSTLKEQLASQDD